MTFGPVCSKCMMLNETGTTACRACLSRLEGGEPTRIVRLVSEKQGERVGLANLSGTGSILIGRSEGEVVFDGDALMSPRHVEIVSETSGVYLVDQGSHNGVYLRVSEAEIRVGDMFMCASEVLRLVGVVPSGGGSDGDDEYMGSPPADGGALVLQQVLFGGRAGASWVRKPPIVIGRDSGDVIFPDDSYVSSRHSTIERSGKRIVLRDLESANGTWLRIKGEYRVKDGDCFFAGRQMIKIEIKG